ncbi:hypothetical protein [Candidatus Palauibacter sp.]|uniref:hypothetical protein n=1 Tax=Candidatus Palauibacter sp. TaxID=3101350 RepID=UPI003B58B6B7
MSHSDSPPDGRARRRGLVVLLCAVLTVPGCYSYRLTEEAPVGAVARMRVPLRSAVANPNAPPGTVAIEGKIISVGDSIRFEASTRHTVGLFRDVVQYDTLSVARDGLVSIEVREFSTTKSVLLGAGIAAGTAALAVAAAGVGGGDAGGGPGSDAPQASTAVSVSVPVTSIGQWFGRALPSLLGLRP